MSSCYVGGQLKKRKVKDHFNLSQLCCWQQWKRWRI